MHNTYSSSYGYGWTALSLVPVVGGWGSLLTYMFMKVWIVGFVLLWFAMKRLARVLGMQKEYESSKWLFFLNPLVLIETFSNAHNDVWMMAPVVLACSLVLMKSKKGQQWLMWFVALVLLTISASIKFATLALIPVLCVLIVKQFVKKNMFIDLLAKYWPEFASVVLFLPLLTSRSQNFTHGI